MSPESSRSPSRPEKKRSAGLRRECGLENARTAPRGDRPRGDARARARGRRQGATSGMFCAISGATPTHPVVTPGGVLYERSLIVKAIEVRESRARARARRRRTRADDRWEGNSLAKADG